MLRCRFAELTPAIMNKLQTNNDEIAIVSADFSEEQNSPFGIRYGNNVFVLSEEHLKALHSGKQIALDVQNEYVVYLKLERTSK